MQEIRDDVDPITEGELNVREAERFVIFAMVFESTMLAILLLSWMICFKILRE